MTENSETATPERAQSGLGWLRRLALLLVFTSLLATYPVSMALSHRVADQFPTKTPAQVWADARIGTAIELLERETLSGWASGRPDWHPQRQLTAMPAFQKGITDVLAAFVSARLDEKDGDTRDTDLSQAQNLLREIEGPGATDRAYAAMEALKRYDGRKARSLLTEAPYLQDISIDMALFEQLIISQMESLRIIAGRESRGVFNREDVRIYYHAKGVIYATGMLVRAYGTETAEITGLRNALLALNLAYDRAVDPAPLTVSNPQPGDFSLEGNDIMQLAFLTSEVQRAINNVQDLLSDQNPSA